MGASLRFRLSVRDFIENVDGHVFPIVPKECLAEIVEV